MLSSGLQRGSLAGEIPVSWLTSRQKLDHKGSLRKVPGLVRSCQCFFAEERTLKLLAARFRPPILDKTLLLHDLPSGSWTLGRNQFADQQMTGTFA